MVQKNIKTKKRDILRGHILSTAFTFTSHHNICALFYLRDNINIGKTQNSYVLRISAVTRHIWRMCILYGRNVFCVILMITACVSRVIWLKIITWDITKGYFHGENRVFSVIFLLLLSFIFSLGILLYIWIMARNVSIRSNDT